MKRSTFWSSASVVLSLAIMFSSCGQGRTPDQSTATSADTARAVALAAQLPATVRYGTERNHVPPGELLCAQADFPKHLQRGTPLNHAPFLPPSRGIRLSTTSLVTELSKVPTCQPSGPIERCVVVNIGLNDSAQFDVRLQLLCLTYDPIAETYEYPNSADCFQIQTNGGLVLQSNGMQAWKAQGGGWSNYASSVVIQPDNDGKWESLDLDREPAAFIFSEDDLKDLITENGLENGELVIVPIATPEERTTASDSTSLEENFHQGVAWIPAGIQLDDADYPGEPFKKKACDLGSPCPPNYPGAAFAFWTKGTAPRAGCN